MRITVEFDLPQEESDYEVFYNGQRYYNALVALEEKLRSEMKLKCVENAEHFMEMFYDVIHEEGVRLD